MTIKRKLFYVERLLFLDGNRSMEPMSITFPFCIKGNIPYERVKLTLDKIQKRHPVLRARIKGKYIFYEDTDFPPIPLRIVDRVSEETWRTEKEKYVVEPYNFEEGPLFRVLWVKSEEISEFVLTGLHVILDWKSFVLLTKEFFALLNDPDKELKPYLPMRSIKDFIPDVSLTWKEKLIGIVWTNTILRGKLIFATWNKKRPPHRIYGCYLYINNKMFLALKKICAKNKVSYGSISCILFAKLFKARFHPEKSECTIFMTLDIRRFTPSVKKDMCFGFATMIRPKISISDDEDVWEQARFFENELINSAITIQKEHSNSIYHSFMRGLVFGEYYKRIVKLFVKRNLVLSEGQDFTFSNLGKQYPLPKDTEFEMLDTIYEPEIHLPWYNATIFGLSETFSGKLGFAFISNEYQISKEEIIVIRSEFEQAIIDLIKDEITEDDQ